MFALLFLFVCVCVCVFVIRNMYTFQIQFEYFFLDFLFDFVHKINFVQINIFCVDILRI